MGGYIETAIGRASAGKDVETGRRAASQALRQLRNFKPSLVLLFVSSELDIEKVVRGAADIVGDCPIIGTSSAGEIANGYFSHSAVAAVIASPHLAVHAGLGDNVSSDYKKAVRRVLDSAGVSEYFNQEHALHQMIQGSGFRRGFSPAFLIVFSPGATKRNASLSHDIHTELRRASENRIPIFGGASSDHFHFKCNYQILNDSVHSDSISLAFIESDVLFGLGMAHGFLATTKRALVTKASDHLVYELDDRPAVEVCAELLGVPIDQLGDGALWFSQFPFGSTDIYGNLLLQVPECVLPDGAIQFGPVMQNGQVITLMRAGGDDIVRAGSTAWDNALRLGGLKKPCFAMMVSCALRKRLLGPDESKEMDLIRTKTDAPVCGFYAFGEQGLSSDGLPVYSNQSVSMLVLSDELNPINAVMHNGKRIYREFTRKLNKKEAQIKLMDKISRIVLGEADQMKLAVTLSRLLDKYLPFANWRFYLPDNISNILNLISIGSDNTFPKQLLSCEIPKDFVSMRLNSGGTNCGILLAKAKGRHAPFIDYDMVFMNSICRLIANGLKRLEVDRRLANKLTHLEIYNRMNHEVSKSITSNTKLMNIIRHIRKMLNLSYISLWIIDPTCQLMIREATDEDRSSQILHECIKNDELLAEWQTRNCRPVSVTDGEILKDQLKTSSPLSTGFISLPIAFGGDIRGILNSFWDMENKIFFDSAQMKESMEFLSGIVNQFAIFIENKQLNANTTFLKEMHHRVKNNLQNVASILRLQIRHLSGMSAEQALNDSISRIMSIAVAHETLYQKEIGMVDLPELVSNVSALSFATQLEPNMKVEVSGQSVMIPSREATLIALIVNELIQNAVRHASWKSTDARLSITIEQAAGEVSLTVEDEGPGLPKDFNPDTDINLGMKLVRTLVREELRGEFSLDGDEKTKARVLFPLPKNYYELRQ